MSQFENYLHDVVSELIDDALAAKEKRDASFGTKEYDYELGRATAYYEVISLLKSQSDAFNLMLAELAGIDPEKDLL